MSQKERTITEPSGDLLTGVIVTINPPKRLRPFGGSRSLIKRLLIPIILTL